MKSPNIGQDLPELETPTLLIDLDLFESNIRQLYSFCNDNGKAWRPHSKANKSPDIARLLIDHGAIGITCAKLSEAELMVEHGIQSILLANQIVSPGKFATLAQLQRRAEVIAAIDNIAVVKAMGAAAISAKTTIPILIELDIGLKRVGIEPGDKTLALAKAVCGQDGLCLFSDDLQMIDVGHRRAPERASQAHPPSPRRALLPVSLLHIRISEKPRRP